LRNDLNGIQILIKIIIASFGKLCYNDKSQIPILPPLGPSHGVGIRALFSNYLAVVAAKRGWRADLCIRPIVSAFALIGR
jgi:hypothetical protein